MPKFVELWVYLSATPLFGLTATLVVYVLAQAAYVRLHQAPWANPVLWTVVVLACALLATNVSYQTYFAGAQFIHFLLGPAVVALGWPLWQRRAELKQRWGRLLAAALAGGIACSVSAVALGWAFGLPHDVTLLVMSEVDRLKNLNGGGFHTNTINLINISRPIATDVTLYGELWSAVNFDPSRTIYQYSVDTSIAWTVRKNTQIDIGANIGLNRDTPAVQVYMGLAQRY